MNKPKPLALFSTTHQIGFLSIFYASMENPLSIWEKQVRGGSIVRLKELDGYPHLRITGPDILSNFIMSPCAPFATLGIKLPYLVVIAKKVERIFAFEVQIKDDRQLYRRLRFCNYQLRVRRHVSFSYIPLLLEDGWNQMTINLHDMIWRLYETKYEECVRIKVYPNCCLRQIYFAAEPLGIGRVLSIMRLTMRNLKKETHIENCSRELEPILKVSGPNLKESKAHVNKFRVTLQQSKANPKVSKASLKESKPSRNKKVNRQQSKTKTSESKIVQEDPKSSRKESKTNQVSKAKHNELKISASESKESLTVQRVSQNASQLSLKTLPLESQSQLQDLGISEPEHGFFDLFNAQLSAVQQPSSNIEYDEE